jgi:curved DNA-binding protein CbpA
MQNFKDYYDILGVSPDASNEEIKRAFLDKSFILHPDRLVGAPESAKNKAEAELKEVNVAYDTLKDSLRRSDYDAKWRTVNERPKPVVEPQLLRFKDVKPHELQKASITIRNLGGAYKKINISNPNSWVKIVKWMSLTSRDELPLRVEIEAEADEWGKNYLETINVRLDDEETQFTVQLQTIPQPLIKKSSGSPIAKTPTAPNKVRVANKSLFSWMKLLIGIMILASFIGTGITGFLTFTQRLTPIIGSVSFILAVVVFIVLITITRNQRYRWRRPGFGLVFLCAVGVYLVLTFSGVQPFVDYKDFAFNAISNVINSVIKP